MKLIPYDEYRPLHSLITVFTAWKAFLLAIALGTTVSQDYDTSTSLFFQSLYGSSANASALARRLTRWDALYFMKAARDGYVYEQQWAFGAALPLSVRGLLWLVKPLTHLLGKDDAPLEPVAAMIFTTLCHLLAVLALHRLTLVLFGNKTLAYVAAVLHILSPAGLFLSAPYGESPFACLSFIGNLLFAMGVQPSAGVGKRSLAFLGAGISFGLATAFRSNGLISGLLFAAEAVKCVLAFFRQPSFSRVVLLASLIIGGLSIAAGSVVPQTVAWFRYCKVDLADAEPRPWCSRLIPSIYTFVQEHYWNNGFLRYWTPNQLPMFILASPVLTLLLKSGVPVIRNWGQTLSRSTPVVAGSYHDFVLTLAVIQTLVAVLAITNFHVQIITRLASGYPVWYWWVANSLSNGETRKMGSVVVVFMVMYAGIQGGLFASFMPPA
ncbi:GPI mannosyltransferase 2 [Trichoderma chlorosporum]